MNSKFFWIHALTPLHVGSGRGLGYIDLPIIREKVTNFPYIPGSAVKGVIADYHNATDDKREKGSEAAAAFGRQGKDDKDSKDPSNSGSLVFTDARLVCLPIRSLYGTFAWATSPTILRRLKRDAESMGKENSISDEKVPEPADNSVFCTKESCLHKADGNDKTIYLEDLDINATVDDTATKWAEFLAEKIFESKDSDEGKEFIKRFIILHDDVFNFLSETGTEVAAHIRIDSETKIVKKGALWYEESLPAEAILAGIIWCDKVYGKCDKKEKELLDEYTKNIPLLQFGGKATTGKGLVRCLFDQEGGK